jgi:hypothetical protein
MYKKSNHAQHHTTRKLEGVVAELKAEVNELKAEVNELKADVQKWADLANHLHNFPDLSSGYV